MHHHVSLSSIKHQEKKPSEGGGERERRGGGGGAVKGGRMGRRGKREFALDFYKEKSCHTQSVVATCSFGDYSTTGC